MSDNTSDALTQYESWARALRERFEENARRALPSCEGPLGTLCEAMRYAVLGGGKRVRALLVYAAGEATGAPVKALDEAALAVEYVHAYSLVHDDLPSMDNDTLRRGKPTAHVKFGEAIAMLAGDSLQPEAFERLLNTGLSEVQMNKLTFLLARASGPRGMCGGQAIDLLSVGRRIDHATLRQMHEMKTGALISAAVKMGAVCGEPQRYEALSPLFDQYASALGLGFQMVDDILDATAATEELGKTAGKDEAADKPTYVTLLGLEKTRELAGALLNEGRAACTALASRPEANSEGASRLLGILNYVFGRML